MWDHGHPGACMHASYKTSIFLKMQSLKYKISTPPDPMYLICIWSLQHCPLTHIQLYMNLRLLLFFLC